VFVGALATWTYLDKSIVTATDLVFWTLFTVIVITSSVLALSVLLCFKTIPSDLSLFSVYSTLTVNPASPINFLASSSVFPKAFGTSTLSLPLLIVRVKSALSLNSIPDWIVCLIINPVFKLSLFSSSYVILPTYPRSANNFSASSVVFPVKSIIFKVLASLSFLT